MDVAEAIIEVSEIIIVGGLGWILVSKAMDVLAEKVK